METKIILELGCNHQGDLNIAKKMIYEAKGLDVWAVKFQKRDIDSFSEGLKMIPREPVNSFGKNYYEHRAALEFTVKEMNSLKEYAENLNLVPIVSVFDMVSAKQMYELGFKHIKLPSQHYSNFALNNYLLRKGLVSTYVSTGMHTIEELFNWQYLDKYSVVMYCRSIYPAENKDISIGNFLEIKKRIAHSDPHPSLGYSSHEKYGKMIKYFVLLGAKYIERHFTLDKKLKGSDHSTVSSDVEEIETIISEIEEMEEYLTVNYDLSGKEKAVRKVYRGF